MRKDLSSVALVTAFLAFVGAAHADIKQRWDDWKSAKLAMIPRGESAIDPRNGKKLSTSEGAKRSRDKRFQAADDALELRGKTDPEWIEFANNCAQSKRSPD